MVGVGGSDAAAVPEGERDVVWLQRSKFIAGEELGSNQYQMMTAKDLQIVECLDKKSKRRRSGFGARVAEFR